MKFIVISDIHYTNKDVQQNRPITTFIKRSLQTDIDFAVVTGDLTDNGYDGKITCGCLMPFLGKNSSITGGSSVNQLNIFINEFVQPIDEVKPLYLIQGNHDKYNGASRYPVAEFIKKRYGSTYYRIDKNGIVYLFCDVYPNAEICLWIKNMNLNINPVIIFFHYNIQDEFSDWWSIEEKSNFAKVIYNLNVMAIFVGHYHKSYTYKWKDIPVYSTAGEFYAVCTVNTGILTVAFENM